MLTKIVLGLTVFAGSAQAGPMKVYDEFQLINRFERRIDNDAALFCSTGLGTDEFCRLEFQSLRVKLIKAQVDFAHQRWRLKNEVLLLHDEFEQLVETKMN